jgi:DNA-binding CsgD family transcriptional regulator
MAINMLLFQLVTHTRKENQVILLLLQKINYQEHQWLICVDLKMVHSLLEQLNNKTATQNILVSCVLGQ